MVCSNEIDLLLFITLKKNLTKLLSSSVFAVSIVFSKYKFIQYTISPKIFVFSNSCD